MMKCLSACCITATGVLTIAAILGVVKLDVDFEALSGGSSVEAVAIEFPGMEFQSRSASGQGISLNGPGISETVSVATIQETAAAQFYLLQAGDEASSGWVTLSLASNQSIQPPHARTTIMPIARVAVATDMTETVNGAQLPASYIFAYSVPLKHQTVEPLSENPDSGTDSVRYRF